MPACYLQPGPGLAINKALIMEHNGFDVLSMSGEHSRECVQPVGAYWLIAYGPFEKFHV